MSKPEVRVERGPVTQNEAFAIGMAKLLEREGKTIAAAELRRLHAENFALAAGQCMNVVGDEGGTPMCVKAQQLQAARERDNVSFKQLLAQRDALLEALELAADFLEHSTEFRIGHPGFEQAQAKARAAIKAVKEKA